MIRSWSLLAAIAVSMLLPAPAFASALLPDLGMAQINDISIDTTAMPGHRLLRYNALLPNVGAGPFEVFASRASTSDVAMSVAQIIYQSGGGTRSRATGATVQYMSGAWRLQALEAGWLQNSSGQVAALVKHWYCPMDDKRFNLTLPGAPQTRVYTGCGQQQPDLLSLTLGVSVGWADYYGPTSFQQYIDITNVPDGTYRLFAKADPNKAFRESNEANNATWTKIKITGSTVTILAYGPHM